MYTRELYHYNKNHDPRNGQFTSGPGGPYRGVFNANRPNSSTRTNTSSSSDNINRAFKSGPKGKPSPAEKIASNVNQGFREARNLNRTAYRKKADYSKLTDKELRDRVNRLNLERQYAQLSGGDMTRGQQKVDRILEVGGNIAAVGASAASIAAAIYTIRHY